MVLTRLFVGINYPAIYRRAANSVTAYITFTTQSKFLTIASLRKWCDAHFKGVKFKKLYYFFSKHPDLTANTAHLRLDAVKQRYDIAQRESASAAAVSRTSEKTPPDILIIPRPGTIINDVPNGNGIWRKQDQTVYARPGQGFGAWSLPNQSTRHDMLLILRLRKICRKYTNEKEEILF